jgi:hypothetical protein
MQSAIEYGWKEIQIIKKNGAKDAVCSTYWDDGSTACHCGTESSNIND